MANAAEERTVLSMELATSGAANGARQAFQLSDRFSAISRNASGQVSGRMLSASPSALTATYALPDSAFLAALKLIRAAEAEGAHLRAGLHYVAGSGNEPADDAARKACGYAAPGEILVTGTTFPLLCNHFRQQCTAVKSTEFGDGPMALYSCRKLGGEQTVVMTHLAQPAPSTVLLLSHGDNDHLVAPGAAALSIGRAEDCAIVITGDRCSRLHALIEYTQGHYTICDQSTNGLHIEDSAGNLRQLNRQTAMLQGSGALLFGADGSGTAQDRISYTIQDTDD